MANRIRVLICDDNEPVRVTLTRALKYKRDIEVLGEVASFDELVAVLGSQEPDVILMDVNMPGTNGLEGLKRLRSNGITTPVIVMSADRRNEDHAAEAGAQGFFYKGTTDLSKLVTDILATTA